MPVTPDLLCMNKTDVHQWYQPSFVVDCVDLLSYICNVSCLELYIAAPAALQLMPSEIFKSCNHIDLEMSGQ